MLEIYNLYWKEQLCGEVHYDTKADRFSAYLHRKVDGEYPIGLFTIDELPEVGDEIVRSWFENRVAPRTRENIRDVLYEKGLQVYDAWELFKANGGWNANDYCTIVRKS